MSSEKDKEIDEAATADAIDAAVERLQQRVVHAIEWLRRQVSIAELEQITTRGGSSEDVLAADVQSAAEAIATEVNDVYLDAGGDAAKVVGEVADTPGHYNATETRAVRRMQENDLRLVTNVTAEQRMVIREVLVEGMRDHLNPRTIAEDLYDVIGLTPQQARWVTSYRRALLSNDPNELASALDRELRDARHDRTILRAVDGKTTLTKAQVDKLVEKYRKNALRLRAETIARTEALRAVHQGHHDAIQAAIDRGDMTPDQVAQTWWTKIDGRERDTHHDLFGQTRAWGEAFESSSGALLMYPGDEHAPAAETVNCRCRLQLVFSPAVAKVFQRGARVLFLLR